jgi:predicted transcriptional regulator
MSAITASSMPHEIMTWYLLPAIRSEMAKCMIRSGMRQREVARKLGVTDAAVSQYVSGRRACDVSLEPSVRAMVRKSAKKVKAGADVVAEINGICEYCTAKLVVCRLHRAHGAPGFEPSLAMMLLAALLLPALVLVKR